MNGKESSEESERKRTGTVVVGLGVRAIPMKRGQKGEEVSPKRPRSRPNAARGGGKKQPGRKRPNARQPLDRLGVLADGADKVTFLEELVARVAGELCLGRVDVGRDVALLLLFLDRPELGEDVGRPVLGQRLFKVADRLVELVLGLV